MAQIGMEFVRRYAQYIRAGQRNLVVALYRPNSKMIRRDRDVAVRLTTLHDIVAEIMSWDFTISPYYICSCVTMNQGILTMMIGNLRRTGSTRIRKFTQALILAPDNIADAYYILNEIFCFHDEPDHDESTVTLYPDEVTDDNDPNSSTYVFEDEVTSQPALMSSNNLHVAAAMESESLPNFPNPLARDLTSLSQTMESDESLNMPHITLHSSTEVPELGNRVPNEAQSGETLLESHVEETVASPTKLRTTTAASAEEPSGSKYAELLERTAQKCSKVRRPSTATKFSSPLVRSYKRRRVCVSL